MGLFSWFGKRKPSSLDRQAELARQAGRAAGEAAKNAGAARIAARAARPKPGRDFHPSVGRSRTTRNLVHLDATFDPDEHAAFLLGIEVKCRSSWVDVAQWNETTAVMTLTIDAKGYDFPEIDFQAAEVFSRYLSKGKWFWEVYRARGAATGEAFDIVKMGGRAPGRR